jgi:adenine/guanine phosphoribosyltransferase-like PRPP-binding protein
VEINLPSVAKVTGIESRGFLLGGAVALALGTGFVGVRKAGGLLPGSKVVTEAEPDYRGQPQLLRMQAVLRPTDRVLLVDDWAELGRVTALVRADEFGPADY